MNEPMRFGVYEVQPESAQVLKRGSRLKLHEKSFQVLMALVSRPGELVTREELKRLLWPRDVFVDFDNNLNNAVGRLREALGDSAANPRFVETVPREGYRFIVPVEIGSASRSPGPSRRWRLGVSVAVGVMVLLGLTTLAYRTLAPRVEPPKSVVVLPFATPDPTGEPNLDYLAFGLTEAVTAGLSQVRALKVISQTSARQYENTTKSLPQIANELNVDAVVEGSVLLEGDDARVTVQLIDASTDLHLWSGIYDRKVETILSVQREVAQAIANEIRVRLPEPKEPSSPEGTVSLAAQTSYLKGRYFLERGTQEGVDRAIRYFEDAIDADPNHAASYAGLADTYAFRSSLSPDIGMEKAEAYTRKALSLDANLADAHVSLAFVLFQKEWDWTAADLAFQRALELDPSHAQALRLYGLFLTSMGRPRDGQELLVRALELDPVSIDVHDVAGSVLYLAREYRRAVEEAREIMELDAAAPQGPYHLALNMIQLGQFEESVAASRTGLSLSAGDPAFHALIAHAQGRLGQLERAGRSMVNLERVSEAGYVPPYFRVFASLGSGQFEEALTWLEEGFRQRDPYLVFLAVDPSLYPLRGEPRFRALLERMAFPSTTSE